MGSFDGWSQGKNLSPEYTGSYTMFSTTLLLRPGRYDCFLPPLFHDYEIPLFQIIV